VVGPATDTHVTIRIKATGVTYASDIFRLRHMTPLPAPKKLPLLSLKSKKARPLPGAPSQRSLMAKATGHAEMAATTVLSAVQQLLWLLMWPLVWLLHPLLSLVRPPLVMIGDKPLHENVWLAKTYFPTLKDVRVNPAAKRGAQSKRFAAAVAAAGECPPLDFLLHGTPEHNIDSILASGLRGRTGCNTRWLTSCPDIAKYYAQGTQRVIIFAVLKPTPCSSFPGKAYTINTDAHHLPLFVARF
jgi:hypothetical protein